MKQAGLSLLDPTKKSPENWTMSCVITGHLVTALRGQEEFRKENHSTYLQEGRAEVRNQSALRSEEALTKTLEGAPVQDAHRLQRATNTGSWLTVQPSTVNEEELGV